jgi:hypothetical protein
VLVVVLSLAFVSSSFGAEPWEGSWKLNIAKSPATKIPPPRNQTFTFEATGQGLSSTEEITPANGEPYRVTCKANFDDRDYPVSGSRAGAEKMSIRRPETGTLEFVSKKKDGTILATYRSTVSADGRIAILQVWYGPEVSGPPNQLRIYDKQ